MQWFRMYYEFATDPKVQMLSESNQRRLVMLFCLRCNNDVTLHDNEIAFQLRITEKEWQETKSIFLEKGFINKNNEILNWEKRQYLSDSSAERVRKHREKMKRPCNVTVTPPDTDTDTDTDTDIILTCFDLYNSLAHDVGLTVVQVKSDKRKRALRERLKECGGIDGWADCLEKVRASKFLTGDNKNAWKADFDFITTKSKFAKIMEGSYDNTEKPDFKKQQLKEMYENGW